MSKTIYYSSDLYRAALAALETMPSIWTPEEEAAALDERVDLMMTGAFHLPSMIGYLRLVRVLGRCCPQRLDGDLWGNEMVFIACQRLWQRAGGCWSREDVEPGRSSAEGARAFFRQHLRLPDGAPLPRKVALAA